MQPLLFVFIAVLLGTGLRTLAAWLSKIIQGEAPIFDLKFFATMALALIGWFMGSVAFLLTIPVPENAQTTFLLFLTNFFGSYTTNDLINRGTTAIANRNPK